MKYMHIPIGIKWELVIATKLSGLLEDERWPFILVNYFFFSLIKIESITLGLGEEVNEVAGRAWVWIG